MSKLVVLGLALGVVGLLTFAAVAGPVASASEKPCIRKKFKTELVRKACKDGGQRAALKAMKDFVEEVKEAKRESGDGDFELKCQACHTKLGGDFPLKKGGLRQFRKHKAFLDQRK